MAYQPGDNTFEAPEEVASVTAAKASPRPSAGPPRASGKVESVTLDIAENGGVMVRTMRAAPSRNPKSMTGMTEPSSREEKTAYGSYGEARDYLDELMGFVEEAPPPAAEVPASPDATAMSATVPPARNPRYPE